MFTNKTARKVVIRTDLDQKLEEDFDTIGRIKL